MGSRLRRAAGMPRQRTDAYAFTRLGGYSSTFPTNGYTTSVDIYLDMRHGRHRRQFEWSSAISNTAGGHRRDFIFHVGTNPPIPASSW